MKNLINLFVLAKVLKKYNLTPQYKQQLSLLSKRKTTSWEAIQRFGRKIEFKQSAVDKQQNQLQQK